MAKALLVMDMQVGIVAHINQPQTLLNNIKATIEAARKKNIKVIYVTVQFRNDFAEISDNNKIFAGIKSRTGFNNADNVAVHADLAPTANDIHVMKRRVSAFAGSDLEVVLRAQKVDELILTGIASSGVVLSTLREAADKDFKLTILEDCCADNDAEVHDVLMKKIFPRQADVITHTAWIDTLK